MLPLTLELKRARVKRDFASCFPFWDKTPVKKFIEWFGLEGRSPDLLVQSLWHDKIAQHWISSVGVRKVKPLPVL